MPAPASAPASTDTDFLPQRGATTLAPDGTARLMSVDALRGFDMFWIAGGGYVVSALQKAAESNAFLGLLKKQLSHVQWEGFAFYDMIFPLFVFLSGVSIAFSLKKALEKGGRALAMRRVLVRGILLFALGIIYSGGIRDSLENVRVLGVLQRIAIAYTGAALLYLFFKPKALIAWVAAILLGYYAAFHLVPVRNFQFTATNIENLRAESGIQDLTRLYESVNDRVTGVFAPGLNFVNHFDFRYLPGKRYDTWYDPEGILSNIPAVASALLGVLAGILLQREKLSPGGRSLMLASWGLVSLIVGFLWGFKFPIVKKLWTSTFVLVAGGYSLLLLALFHQVVDVLRWRAWCQPLVWIGMNSIAIYFGSQLLRYGRIAERFIGPAWRKSLGPSGDVLVAMLAIVVLFAFARFLHRRNLFIRL